MMGKAPAYQWYTGDWRKDPQVQMACMVTRGTWREMLDCMWDAPERGKLTGTAEQIQKLLGCTKDEWEIFFQEFTALKIGDVTTDGDGIMTFTNRRMFRQEQERISHSKRQLKYRHLKRDGHVDDKSDGKVTEPCDAKVTPPSSSSSSSSIKNITQLFEKFWKIYPPRNGRKVTKKESFQFFKDNFKTEEEVELLLKATENYAASIEAKKGFAKDAIRFFKKDFWKDWTERTKNDKW